MVFDSYITQRLTQRELDVAGLMVLGHTNREIATSLVVEPCTSKAHVTGIIKKLNATNRVNAAFIIGQHIIKDDINNTAHFHFYNIIIKG